MFFKRAKLLLAQGARINQSDKNGETALHIAVKQGNLSLVNMLLQRGADINKANKNGETPFQVAREKPDAALENFIIAYSHNQETIREIYVIFDKIRSLPYQYKGRNPQRQQIIKKLNETAEEIEKALLDGKLLPGEILRSLKEKVSDALRNVTENHQNSSHRFFKFIKQNFTQSRLAKLLEDMAKIHCTTLNAPEFGGDTTISLAITGKPNNP